MITYRFSAQALTPIHIGCGTEIDPTCFVLKGNSLIQINPVQIIEDLSAEDKERFTVICERADLKEIQNFLSSKADIRRHRINTVEVSKRFRREFEVKASNPNNQFNVSMMPRSAINGTVYLPGSSLKGAIRTAVVNYFINDSGDSMDRLRELLKTKPPNKRGVVLEEEALRRKNKETEKDLFRLISIEDVHLPDGATRIDKVSNFHPDRSGSKKIQMWFERLRSLADEYNPPSFHVTLRINNRAMSDEKVKAILGRTIKLNTIMNACNRFYWNRMQAEGEMFDGRCVESDHWKAIHDCFPKGKLEDGQNVTIDPDQPFWNNRDYNMRHVLLRIGRFSHFESLSVDELRQGFNAKTKRPILGMGSSRTRCEMESGKPPMPFGWLILRLKETFRS